MRGRAALVCALACASLTGAQTAVKDSPDDNLIQMAVLLDASNSMDGLIGQAKSQLWKIVNEMALAKRNGKSPRLEVGFYEYGKDNIPSAEGHLRQIVPLTADLDKISEELFKVSTNGGEEYCGRVIDAAVDGLAWNPGSRVLKAIFIAGNEPFTQGQVNYVTACKKAISKGIIVNTIFCGSNTEGIETKWKEGASLADGTYMSIDQNQKVVHIDAPQDAQILKLNEELNATYVAYGSAGSERKKLQTSQDQAAAGQASEVMVQRSMAKASVQYDNRSWDLVDAQKTGSASVASMPAEQLPSEMKKMSSKERVAYVDSLSKKRAEIQAKIAKLSQERRTYVEAETKKQGQNSTLDKAVTTAVREQAARKGFSF